MPTQEKERSRKPASASASVPPGLCMRSCKRSRRSESESGDDFAGSSRGPSTGVMPGPEIRQGRDRDRIGGVMAHREEGSRRGWRKASRAIGKVDSSKQSEYTVGNERCGGRGKGMRGEGESKKTM